MVKLSGVAPAVTDRFIDSIITTLPTMPSKSCSEGEGVVGVGSLSHVNRLELVLKMF
jgi:hypothetical protein